MSTKTQTQTKTVGPTEANNPLFKQYGGIHSGKWVDLLPSSWHPFIQLARLSPPTAMLLIYFPHAFGIIYGAIVTRASIKDTLSVALWLLGGTFFYSNSAHGWDDYVDEPIDRLIPRTQKRPIVRGAVTPFAALVFTIVQALFAAAFLIPLPPVTALYAAATCVGATYYPFSKRHISTPQLVLGFTLANGISVGAAAMGADPLENNTVPYLLVASGLWSVIYDTVYGSLDMKDDIKLGIGNTAVLLGKYMKHGMFAMLVILIASLVGAGQASGFDTAYYAISILGCGVPMAAMIAKVKLEDGPSVWWWFSHGFWMVGMALSVALLTEYVPLVN